MVNISSYTLPPSDSSDGITRMRMRQYNPDLKVADDSKKVFDKIVEELAKQKKI